MSARSMIRHLAVVVLLAGARLVHATIDKAVYDDMNYPTSWTSAVQAGGIFGYFNAQAYTLLLNAAGLRAFMLQHIASRNTSVVVLAGDVLPAEVLDPILTGSNPNPNPSCTLNQYLKTGGKVVLTGDWPAYSVGFPFASLFTWADAGAAQALEFAPAKWGYDGRGMTVFTAEGIKWGLKKPWASQRADDPSEIGLVLGMVPGSPAAMPWVKQYTGRPGAGMVYMYDNTLGSSNHILLGQEEMEQIQRVAEYFPKGEVALDATIGGVVRDASANPVAGLKVRLTAPGIAADAITDSSGAYSFLVPAGDYTLSLPRGYEPMPTPVSVNFAGTATRDLSAVPLPTLPSADLGTSSTPPVTALAWSGVGNCRDVRPDNLNPADPAFPESLFQTIAIPSDLGSFMPVGNNSWYWMRIHFPMPPGLISFQGKGFHLYNYNVDDSDVSFLNGHFIGTTFWQWNVPRDYDVPSAWLNFGSDNVLAILGNNGVGGAGINNAVPKLQPIDPFHGDIVGRVVTQTGAGAGGMAVTAKAPNGALYSALTSPIDGSYRLTGLIPNSYTLLLSGYGALPLPQTVNVVAGEAATAPQYTVTGAGAWPAGILPVSVASMFDQDIGTTGGSWSANTSTGRITINADGDDIWGNADAFNYAFLPTFVTGDFTAAVKVLENGGCASDWSKAGIMLRTGVSPGLVHAFATSSDMHGGDLQYRPIAGNASTNTAPDNWFPLGTYLVLVRKGNEFTVYQTDDGSQPRLVGSTAIENFTPSAALGLAVTSHQNGQLIQAAFEDFKFAPTPWEPPLAPLPACCALPGDLNEDGKTDIKDATLSLQIAVNATTPTAAQKAAGDVNKDGRLNLQDTTLILGAAVGMTTLTSQCGEIDFRTAASSATFTVPPETVTLSPTPLIINGAGFDLGYGKTIDLSMPVPYVALVLTHAANSAPAMTALANSTPVASATMSADMYTPQRIVLYGAGINRVAIFTSQAPADEAQLLKFCFDP